MGDKGLDFKHKEVVNINDGKKTSDLFKMFVQICKLGKITSIIVPGNAKFLNIFAGNNDIVIPWEKKNVLVMI